MEARVFQVVRLCEPTSTGCSQWATSLLYSFCTVFQMITICCEVSYLYIGLLTQLSYLIDVGFLNRSICLYNMQAHTCTPTLYMLNLRISVQVWDCHNSLTQNPKYLNQIKKSGLLSEAFSQTVFLCVLICYVGCVCLFFLLKGMGRGMYGVGADIEQNKNPIQREILSHQNLPATNSH